MKKKIIVLIVILICIAGLVIGLFYDDYKTIRIIGSDANKFIQDEVNVLVNDFITDDNIYSKLAKISTQSENDSVNILNEEVGFSTWGLTLIEDKEEFEEWQEKKEEAINNINTIFVSGEIKKGTEEYVVDEDGTIYYTFRYMSKNKTEYLSYLNNLGTYFVEDYFVTIKDKSTYNQTMDAIAWGKAYTMANILLGTDFIDEKEYEVTIHIRKIDGEYKIINYYSVLEALNGTTDESLGMFDDEKSAKWQEEVMDYVYEVYKKAIEDGRYNPEQPLTLLK